MDNTSTPTRWSSEQETIFGWFQQPDGSNAVVNAYAGTGKTTTIIEGVNRAPETSILLAAFNKRIADELQTRITNPNAVAKTLHAVGFAAINKVKRGLRLLKGNERADLLARKVCTPQVPDDIVRMISKLHTQAREMAPLAVQGDQLLDIAEQFQCTPDESFEEMGYDTRFVCDKAIEAMVLAANDFSGGIDFTDMLYLPLRNGWLSKAYDLVVIDEAQDMNLAQLLMAQRICRGRIAVVGDRHQAIYVFRGADSSGMDRLKTQLNAVEFSLSTTYRCGKAIVATAQSFGIEIFAHDDNHDGLVRTLEGRDLLMAQAEAGNFILSRTNAPLVSVAMAFLRAGRPTRVAGRNLGTGLKAIVRKLKATSVPNFIQKLGGWQKRELTRAAGIDAESRRQARVDLITDQYDMLLNLADGAVAVRDIDSRIDALFADNLTDHDVIICSSVHRAKGLEAKTVFVLKDTLRTHTQEEHNIHYVAVTRAKQELVYVTGIK